MLALFLFSFSTLAPLAQQPAPEVPTNFRWDMQTAARLRPLLRPQSSAVSGRYVQGRLAFETLIDKLQVRPPNSARLSWELRIVNDNLFNAYSLPDGTIYVESGLAELAGTNAGLWAAILSHEIAHVVRRDWARRYLYEKSLQGGAAALLLGDPGLPTANWMDSQKASADLASFCRQMEIDADRESLMLMARAGFHPDFVPALHHLLHAQTSATKATSIYAMHPCWETRDQQLDRAYTASSIEFARLWQDWYASPGGNPPIVVFEEEPAVRKTAAQEWQVQVPLRCQNLAGAVEVVLLPRSSHRSGVVTAPHETVRQLPQSSSEFRELTGCTSPKTTITFTLTDDPPHRKTSEPWADVYVLDAQGSVLSRAEVPHR
jgi:hypothetical protein